MPRHHLSKQTDTDGLSPDLRPQLKTPRTSGLPHLWNNHQMRSCPASQRRCRDGQSYRCFRYHRYEYISGRWSHVFSAESPVRWNKALTVPYRSWWGAGCCRCAAPGKSSSLPDVPCSQRIPGTFFSVRLLHTSSLYYFLRIIAAARTACMQRLDFAAVLMRGQPLFCLWTFCRKWFPRTRALQKWWLLRYNQSDWLRLLP